MQFIIVQDVLTLPLDFSSLKRKRMVLYPARSEQTVQHVSGMRLSHNDRMRVHEFMLFCRINYIKQNLIMFTKSKTVRLSL